MNKIQALAHVRSVTCMRTGEKIKRTVQIVERGPDGKLRTVARADA